MAKTKSSKTPTTTPAATPVPTPVEPKTSKKASKKAPTKSEPKAVSNVVVEPSVEVVVTEEPTTHNDETCDIASQISELMTTFQRLSTEARAAATKLRALDKQFHRTLRIAQKSNNKKRKSSGAPRAPSGFVKPTRISDELASFLNKPHGTEMARTEVTKEINQYIRSNNLQDEKNGRIIKPNSKLRSLLKIGANDELTYFNLQKYMSPHFAKMSKATSSSA